MNGATQVINLAAGYLAPAFRGRRVRSFTDLIELLDCLFNLLRQASGSAVCAILSDVDSRLDQLRSQVSAKAWHTAVARIREHPFMGLIGAGPADRARHLPSYAILHDSVAKLGRFDFIYAGSLLDRLDDAPARKTVAAAFAMLSPGGKLLLGNLAPRAQGAAWFEAFMDCWPYYRDQMRLATLLDSVPAGTIAAQRTFAEPTENENSLEITHV